MTLSLMSGSACADTGPSIAPVTITKYTDLGQKVPWGYQSHWLQPWRTYLDTVPARTLLDAIGINFNVNSIAADPTAELLANSGFRRARIEVGWNSLQYDDPSQMTVSERQSLDKIIETLRDHHIRPLILLNANDSEPCPAKYSTLHLTQPAPAGATQIHIAPADISTVVPGRTGISFRGHAAFQLITSVSQDGTAKMSQPLREAAPAGDLKVVTLRYEPFRPATLPDGSPNPEFEPTMQGWLNYVGVVTREVSSVLGSDEFDVEVWNELSFGSMFLTVNSYYEPDIVSSGPPTTAILTRTIEYLRNPAHQVPHVGIGNGFANQRPWSNGTESPIGLTAIDKHPYAGWRPLPYSDLAGTHHMLNGLGESDGSFDANNNWHATFTPSYNAFFPEYFLSGIETETLINDLAPYTSKIVGVDHGRTTHPEGGSPPTMWVTEVNLDPQDGPNRAMTTKDVRHIETKEILRYITSFVNKGVTAIHFYAVRAGNESVVDPNFFKTGASGYPGDAAGGETTDAVRRLTAAMHGTRPIVSPRTITLKELTDYSSNIQFPGNGTPQYPPLYNRDVFAFLPFQVTDTRFVIPVYVMTRDVSKVNRPGAPTDDPMRFDLPPEPYQLAMAGLEGSTATVTVSDPLTGEAVPVEVISRSNDELVINMPVTDSPRLLEIQEHPATPINPPASPSSLSAEGQPSDHSEGAASLQLRGHVRSLFSTRRLHLEAHCRPACTLRVRGRLTIGGRSLPMTPTPRKARLSSTYTSVDLSINRTVARLGRDAIRRGSSAKMIVVVRAKFASGDRATARRVLVLGRRQAS